MVISHILGEGMFTCLINEYLLITSVFRTSLLIKKNMKDIVLKKGLNSLGMLSECEQYLFFCLV